MRATISWTLTMPAGGTSVTARASMLEGLRRRGGRVGSGGDLADEITQDVRGGEESVDHLGGDGKETHADLLEEALENVGEARDLREAHHRAAALEAVGEAEDHVHRV